MSQVPLVPSVEDVKSYFHTWPTNASNAMRDTFSSLSIRDYIRIVWIIGGYVFMRPYLEKLFRKMFEKGQARQHAEEEEEEREAAAEGRMTANDLRGTSTAVKEDEVDDEDEELVNRKVPQWGRNARLRQKKAMRLIEEEFERRKEEEDDKDIADLLED
ncbi:hypothetical protein KEM55_004039 [Ascosphaera atra]|nr:hypothetical protein KEM55_004039 [Ascosphaera atra]